MIHNDWEKQRYININIYIYIYIYIYNILRLILINLGFREKKGIRGDSNHHNLLDKSKHLMPTVQIAIFLSGICFFIDKSFAFLEKLVLALYHYCGTRKFENSLLVLLLLLQKHPTIVGISFTYILLIFFVNWSITDVTSQVFRLVWLFCCIPLWTSC